MVGQNISQVGWPACGEVDMLENYGYRFVQTSVHTPNQTDTGILTKYRQFQWITVGMCGAWCGTTLASASTGTATRT